MRTTIRAVIAAVIAISVAGCGEFSNRGGFMDRLGDRFIFRADTREFRLFRGYGLVAALLRVGAKSPFTMTERSIAAEHSRIAITLAREAWDCALKAPSVCAHFDTIMADFDRALIKLAVDVFTAEETNSLYVAIRRGFKQYNAFEDVLAVGGSVLSAGGQVAGLAAKALNGVSAILQVAGEAYELETRLAPVYRDLLSLTGQVVIDSLTKKETKGGAAKDKEEWPCAQVNLETTCRDKALELQSIYQNGNGALSALREKLKEILESDGALRYLIIPKIEHFHAVSLMIIRACKELVGDKDIREYCAGYDTDDKKRQKLIGIEDKEMPGLLE